MRLLASCILFLSLLVSADHSPSHTLHLHRRQGISHSSGGYNRQSTLDSIVTLQEKFNPSIGANFEKRESIPLKEVVSSQGATLEYYVEAFIGTPKQKILLDIDTGSADLWTKSAVGHETGRSEGFSSKLSSTFSTNNAPFSVNYGSGGVKGTIATDTITIGTLTVPRQSFGLATSTPAFDDSPAHGLLGLAFQSVASVGPTFVDNLFSAGKIPRIVAAHLTRFPDSSSSLTLGGIDPGNFVGSLNYFPVVERGLWTIDGSIIVNGVKSSSFLAAIDTGTTLIALPRALAAQFYSSIPTARRSTDPRYPSNMDLYEVKCSIIATHVFSLSFAGSVNQYPISAADFNFGRVGRSEEGMCVGGVMGIDLISPVRPGRLMAVIGDVFLKSWHSVYNTDYRPTVSGPIVPSVGFAANKLYKARVACPASFVLDAQTNNCVPASAPRIAPLASTITVRTRAPPTPTSSKKASSSTATPRPVVPKLSVKSSAKARR